MTLVMRLEKHLKKVGELFDSLPSLVTLVYWAYALVAFTALNAYLFGFLMPGWVRIALAEAVALALICLHPQMEALERWWVNRTIAERMLGGGGLEVLAISSVLGWAFYLLIDPLR